jgi:large subunit ribosomal protein L18
MSNATAKTQKRTRRHNRIRAKVKGTADRPRLAVYRSNTALYAQIIDDVAAKTIVATDSRKVSAKGMREKARAVGAAIAEAAKKEGVEKVIFDRGGFLYTGAIKEVAEGAREGGLVF